ncbi:MAG TPA: extracellular solute-binding protein [Candidatus Binatia bacterium]|nr:extracellular solute-binding protein [Candidatus Binatia bacterium]
MARLLFLSVIFVLFAARATAASLEDAAKNEGEVVLYSSLNNEQIVTLVEAFKKKHPFIKPSFYRGTSERVLQRASTEAKAGRFAVDVATAAGFQLQLMKESGLTQKYVPPEAAFYNDGFKDPDGHWVSVHSLLNSMAYNTQLLKPNEAPKKYDDLLAPRWKGRLGVNLQDPEWYVSLQRRWGKEKARNFLKALAAQQPGLRDGHNITAQLLAAGEFFAVTNTYAHIAARIKNQGGPVQYVFDEPVITYVHPIALMKSAPHPNAAKLLIGFILSTEGQRMLREQGRIPSHRDIDPLVFSLRNVKLFASDPKFAKEYAPAGEEMRAIFGIR